MENPYFQLTLDFNRGRLRALLSSGQAVVAHRLAIMSKDGDWILREDREALEHTLQTLARRGAKYRFGAPLDMRWLAGGWSAHLEFRTPELRVRTDFVTRPPRISPETLSQMWSDAEASGDAVIALEPLAAIKLTNREKDFAVVGELARQMIDPRWQLRFSRSARDLIDLAISHPQVFAEVTHERPLLAQVHLGREVLEEALDRERRQLMRTNEERLARYVSAAEDWARAWPQIQREVEELPLLEAHEIVKSKAENLLPFDPLGGSAK